MEEIKEIMILGFLVHEILIALNQFVYNLFLAVSKYMSKKESKKQIWAKKKNRTEQR